MKPTPVKAKKHLGQHFLHDENIAQKIVNSLSGNGYNNVLEIGPGTGVLTKYLVSSNFNYKAIDIDHESIAFLKNEFHFNDSQLIQGDFLKLNLSELFNGEPFAVIGNFPYNISSQILFKIADHCDQIPEMVGMFQKEVAERVAEGPGSKIYGTISVLIQAYYNLNYLFTVSEQVFTPPPKVKSGVIRMNYDPKITSKAFQKSFRQVVKTAFNQRRKTLRNSLKPMLGDTDRDLSILNQRPEQLSVDDFIALTKLLLQ